MLTSSLRRTVSLFLSAIAVWMLPMLSVKPAFSASSLARRCSVRRTLPSASYLISYHSPCCMLPSVRPVPRCCRVSPTSVSRVILPLTTASRLQVHLPSPAARESAESPFQASLFTLLLVT